MLRGVDLDVPAGSLTAVLGLSGCGKTTLLRVIAGFERAERGECASASSTLDDGRTYVPPERRSIGYVPQEGALFPHLTSTATSASASRAPSAAATSCRSCSRWSGIAQLASRLPHQLSGGEQQRVALARALARRPQALLLDEPFSSLDASLRARVREEVHGLLREQGVTTVLVTHDQEEALSLADSVAVLRDGTIVQQGPPAELYERPVDERLARFLGAVNVLDASFLGDTAPDPARAAAAERRGRCARRRRRRDGAPRAAGGAAAGAKPSRRCSGPSTGRVEQCRYYGHDALLQIRSGAGELLLARVAGAEALPEGTPVRVRARGAATPLA